MTEEQELDEEEFSQPLLIFSIAGDVEVIEEEELDEAEPHQPSFIFLYCRRC